SAPTSRPEGTSSPPMSQTLAQDRFARQGPNLADVDERLIRSSPVYRQTAARLGPQALLSLIAQRAGSPYQGAADPQRKRADGLGLRPFPSVGQLPVDSVPVVSVPVESVPVVSVPVDSVPVVSVPADSDPV